MDREPALDVYRFAIENLYRQQEHVLDEAGERLMSLASRLAACAERRLLGALDRRREVPEGHALERRGSHRLLRPVPRHPRDAPRAGRPREGVHRAARDLQVVAQHLRGALQRRLPARLVPGPGPRLQEHARGGAARRQHPDLGRRKPDRDDARRRRAAAPLPPAAAPDAQGAVVSRLRLRDPARHASTRSTTTTRCSTGSSTRSRRSVPTTRR